MRATQIGAHRTWQWNERWRSAWMHPKAYSISFFITHFQAATTIGLRDRRFSLHPTVVLNAFLWNKWPADDAAGGNSTWLGNTMRVIGAAGNSGRYLWPLVNMGGRQMMLVAGREKVRFHAIPDRINNHAQRSRTEGTSRRGDRRSCQTRCAQTQNVRTPPSSVKDSTLPLTPLTFQLTPLTPLTLQLTPLTLQLTPLTLQLTPRKTLTCLASEIDQSQFRIGRRRKRRDSRGTEKHRGVSQRYKILGAPTFFSLSTHATETSSDPSHG